MFQIFTDQSDQPQEPKEKILEWIAQVLSIIYFLTPVIQIILLYQKKLRIEKIPMFLLLTIVFNCLFWLGLGIEEGNYWWSMIICNGIGLSVNFLMVVLHLYKFFDKRLGSFIAFSSYLIIALVVVYILIKESIQNDVTRGFIAMVANVLMYSSPFTNIIKLIRTGEYDFLPILTNIIGFFTCTMWIIYGIVYTGNKDSQLKTIISNLISLVMVLIQIIIWLVFFYKKNIKKIIEAENKLKENNINDVLVQDGLLPEGRETVNTGEV